MKSKADVTDETWGPSVDLASDEVHREGADLANIQPDASAQRLQTLSPLEEWAKEMGLLNSSVEQNPSELGTHLAVLVSMARAVVAMSQSAHWQSSGPNGYGDHLLFERIYKDVDGFVDGLGEKAMGMGHPGLLGPLGLTEATARFVTMVPQDGDAAISVLHALTELMGATELLLKSSLSAGIENFLQGMADALETDLYLLRQRVS